MKGTWLRSALPARRFGDEWLALDVDTSSVLVVRGAPALVAVELLTAPRDVGALLAAFDRAAGHAIADQLESLLRAMGDQRHLIVATAPAVPLASPLAFTPEPISFFVDALDRLFSGLSAASIIRGGGLAQSKDQPCGT